MKQGSEFSSLFVSFWAWRLFLAASLTLFVRELFADAWKGCGILTLPLKKGSFPIISLPIGSQQCGSCSWSGLPGVLERAQDNPVPRWVLTSVAYLTSAWPLTSLHWACFIRGRRTQEQMAAGIFVQCPPPTPGEAGSYSEVIKRLGDSASGTGGRQAPRSPGQESEPLKRASCQAFMCHHGESSSTTHVLFRHSVNTWPCYAFPHPQGTGLVGGGDRSCFLRQTSVIHRMWESSTLANRIQYPGLLMNCI